MSEHGMLKERLDKMNLKLELLLLINSMAGKVLIDRIRLLYKHLSKPCQMTDRGCGIPLVSSASALFMENTPLYGWGDIKFTSVHGRSS